MSTFISIQIMNYNINIFLQIFWAIALNFSETEQPNRLNLYYSIRKLVPSLLLTILKSCSIPSWLVLKVIVPEYLANVYSLYLVIQNLNKTCLTEWTPKKNTVHWTNLLHPCPLEWWVEI